MSARWMVAGLCLAVAGCDSPSPGRFAHEARAVAGGDRFAVHWTVEGRRGAAQAIRLNRRWGARPAVVRARAVAAIEQVTGCRVDGRTVSGDANVVRVTLICR